MTKSKGPILAVSLTLIIAALVAVFSFLPGDAPASAAADLNTFSGQDIAYQEQIAQLNLQAQDRQAIYQAQQAELASRLTLGRQRLQELTVLEQTLQQQIEQLNAVRAERQMVYEGQLQEASSQFDVRYAQLQAQLNEALARLAEANAQLGR